MVIAVLGVKGGQGKTTLTVRLGAWLALAGHRTLVVDLAPSGSASLLLGFGGVSVESGSGEVMAGSVPWDRAVREAGHELLLALPADEALVEMARDGSLPSSAVTRLAGLGKAADIVLLDAPPELGGTALAAFLAARWCVVPVVPDELGCSGLEATLAWMKGARSSRTRGARLAGILVNQSQPAQALAGRCEKLIRRDFARETFRTAVRRDLTLRQPGSLARVFVRPASPRGADLDVLAVRRELLRLLVRRA